MNLPEILKQFKSIEPDAAFKEKSKRAVLAQMPKEKWSIRRVIITIFESGMGVALTVFFILIIIGQFPGQSAVTPVQLSVINPETLRAEAQAVDIQIQLANVAYLESTTTVNETTPTLHPAVFMPAIGASSSLIAPATASSTPVSVTSSTPNPTPSSTLSVDQALQELSK